MILCNLKNVYKIVFNCYINCIVIINDFNIVYWCFLKVCIFSVYFVLIICFILSYIDMKNFMGIYGFVLYFSIFFEINLKK